MKRITYRGVILTGLILLPTAALASGCKTLPIAARAQATFGDQPVVQPIATTNPPPPPIRYEVFKISGAKSVRELEAKLGANAFAAVLKINRLDRKHIPTTGVLILPTPAETIDLMNLAPFPRELEFAYSIPKLILVSRRSQAFGAYAAGKLVHWGPTSTGKRATQTPAGLYHTNWRKKLAISSVDASWKLPWCFNLDNRIGVAFHQFDLPGYPASHGCVRLLEEDARWIYDWADQWVLSRTGTVLAYGTPVVIFGDYPFGSAPPWQRLADDLNATSIRASDIEDSLRGYFPSIRERLRSREIVLASLQPGAAQPVGVRDLR
jgi:lipoprotein-anchoring transpeptidase ErfK/SrfK